MLARIRYINGAAKAAKMPLRSAQTVGQFRALSYSSLDSEKLQKLTENALIHEITTKQMQTVQKVVPWFLKSMPASYFRQIPEDLRKQHVKALAAVHDLDMQDLSLKIETKSASGNTEITMLNTETQQGSLLKQLNSLPNVKDHSLANVEVFSSADGQFALNVFSFEPDSHIVESTRVDQAEHIMKYAEELRAGKYDADPVASKWAESATYEELSEYLAKCAPSYVGRSTPRRFLLQKELYDEVRGTDASAVRIEDYHGSSGPPTGSAAWVTIATGNMIPEVLLKITTGMLTARKMDIWRVHMDTVYDPELTIPKDGANPESKGYVTMLRMIISPNPSVPVEGTPFGPEFMANLSTELKRCKWLDDRTIQLGLVDFPKIGLKRAEVITALASMCHGPLAKTTPHAFASVQSVLQAATESPYMVEQVSAIADLFLDKFQPLPPAEHADRVKRVEARHAELLAKFMPLQKEYSRAALLKMLEGVNCTLRTNYFNDNRFGLALRINPTLMILPGDDTKPEIPYGVFFGHGRLYNGFHCRFRDISRGGLRIVTPPNTDQYAAESSRHFDEVYGLSYAQQQKNKDIPEGGSKGVIIVNTPSVADKYRTFVMRKSVRAFVDSLLDLMVSNTPTYKETVVDYFGKDELLYLGPDEQVTPTDIDWIVTRAGQRGYPIPAAFMTSKAGAGINHKEFGVTSEGVWVFLDVALRQSLGIDPNNQPFTIKITGGPDGDVAGNLIKILIREYGDNVKIVGIADGCGVAEDPEGLDHNELLRMVNESLTSDFFNKSLLKSPEGVVMRAKDSQEALVRRNTMHFRVKADAFVPAGGRPNTMNGENWRQFLDINGKPSSPLIVEGANIFNTKEARENLFKEARVMIVKDSSANKCGVVTSSCEVAASMLLTKEEFLDVKKELVHDVIEHFRKSAKAEAELLFSTYKNFPGALPHFSERISNAINKVTDALIMHMADVNPEDDLFQELLPLVKESMPQKLQDIAWDRAPALFPVQYQRNAMASTLASKLVYKEGIHMIETQPEDKLAERAILYFRADQKVKSLVHKLEIGTATPEEMNEAIRMLHEGGARTELKVY